MATTEGVRPRQTLSLATLDAGGDTTYFENGSNDLFETAEPVELTDDPLVIRGRITGPNDVDLYDLGPTEPGDRIIVDMVPDTSLDGAIALFDETGTCLLINDHRNVYLGQKEPFIDFVVPRRMERCFVAAAATPGYRSTGEYGLVATKRSSAPLPTPRPDEVLLVFSGGSNVHVGSRGPLSVPAFDARNIDARYAGQTDSMIEEIVARIREDFAGFDVTVLSTSEGAILGRSMTRLFFGTFDPGLLGVAEGVDEFNATQAQEAIVFTDTFGVFMGLQPTAVGMSQAIANVGSHEIGHLLGLVHTSDHAGIMDITASLNGLMIDQSFRRSPIYSAVFPIGSQDAVQSLLDSVGGDSLLSVLKYLDARSRTRSEPTGPPARSHCYLSSCGLDER